MARHKSWPERKLWAELKDSKLGVRFYCQKAMHGYIADFWCPSEKLIIETDGKYHLQPKQMEYDKNRDAVFASNGIRTIRFTAQEVFNNLPVVVILIQKALLKKKNKLGKSEVYNEAYREKQRQLTNGADMNKVEVFERIASMNTTMGWYADYSSFIEENVNGRNTNGRTSSSSAAIFWGDLDKNLRMILALPERIPGEPCFNFRIEEGVLNVCSKSIKETVEAVKAAQFPQKVAIDYFIAIFHDHLFPEFNRWNDSKDEVKTPDVVPEAPQAVPELPKQEVVENPDKDSLMAGEENPDGIGQRKFKTTNTVRLGPDLHGTIACLNVKGMDPVFAMILSGLRKTSFGTTVSVPIYCNKEAFDFPLAVSIMGNNGHPWIGMTGNPTPVAVEIGSKCRTFQKWFINPDEIGKYKDLADMMAANVPKVIKAGGNVVGTSFSKEIIREMSCIDFDESKYTESIRGLAKRKGYIYDSETVKVVKNDGRKPQEPVKTAKETLIEAVAVVAVEPVVVAEPVIPEPVKVEPVVEVKSVPVVDPGDPVDLEKAHRDEIDKIRREYTEEMGKMMSKVTFLLTTMEDREKLALERLKAEKVEPVVKEEKKGFWARIFSED